MSSNSSFMRFFKSAIFAALIMACGPVMAEQCTLASGTMSGMCTAESNNDILKNYDSAKLPKNTTSSLPVWAYNECFYIDNTSSGEDYFIPLKSNTEFQAFIKNSPSSIEITKCVIADGVTTRGEKIKSATSNKKLASAETGNTIVDVAAGNPDFSTLVTLVQAAGLVDTLKSAGPFTVFAPTNAAFAKLPAATLEFLGKPENKEALKTILTYHVLPFKAPLSAIAGKRLVVKTVQGRDVRVAGNETPPRVNTSNIIVTDVMASNGVIHAIDTVLSVPANVVEQLQKSPNFSTLLSLASPLNTVVSILTSPADVTLFAPTNAAFAALPQALVANITKPENQDILQYILAYHVLGYKQKTQDILGQRVTRVNAVGKLLPIDARAEPILVHQSAITYADAVASNGLIHALDRVLSVPCNPVPRGVITQNCPTGQTGSIKKSVSLTCPNYDRVETVTQNTCAAVQQCTPSKNVTTQACPSGQSGNITRTVERVCDGSNNGAGRLTDKTTSTCTATQSCSPRFLGYAYGSCGNRRYGFVVYRKDRTCPSQQISYSEIYRFCYGR